MPRRKAIKKPRLAPPPSLRPRRAKAASLPERLQQSRLFIRRRLCTTPDVPSQELLGFGIECHAVLGLRKAVPLVREQEIVDFLPLGTQCIHNLLRLSLFHTRVVSALGN